MLVVESCRRYQENGKFGLRDINGNRITYAVYDDLRRIVNANYYLKVKKNNKWGVIGTDGIQVLKIEYKDITFYKDDVFTVEFNYGVAYIKNPRVEKEIKEEHNIRIIKDVGYWEPGYFGSKSYVWFPEKNKKSKKKNSL